MTEQAHLRKIAWGPVYVVTYGRTPSMYVLRGTVYCRHTQIVTPACSSCEDEEFKGDLLRFEDDGGPALLLPSGPALHHLRYTYAA